MQEPSSNFEKLRQLLALKRHEIPPPGYFRDFSRRVMIQIELENDRAGDGWWRRALALFQARPAISASFCAATGLVLVAATTYYEGTPASPAPRTPSIEAIASMPERSALPSAAGSLFLTNLEPAAFALDMVPPTANPAPSNSLFSSPFYLRVEPELRVEPVSYSR